MESNSLETAMLAFRYFADGWGRGDFASFIAMLADEVEFSFPDGELRGHCFGAEGRERMVAKCLGHARKGERLTLHPPSHVTGSGSTVVFEFLAEGMLSGGFFRGEIAIALEVRGAKVVGFREYYGLAE